VREPLDRLRSAWRFLLTGGNGKEVASRLWRRRLSKLSTFGAFVKGVFGDGTAASAWDEAHWSNLHITLRPAFLFLTDRDGTLIVTHLLRFEEIGTAAGVAALATVRTAMQAPPAPLVHVRLTPTPREKALAASAEEEEEIRAIVGRAYAKDYELLGYKQKSSNVFAKSTLQEK